MTFPKYAQPEIEKRMLVEAALLPDLDGLDFTVVEDRYLEGGRMRLRKIHPAKTGQEEYKLCKKYGAIGMYEEPIVNVYLTQEEYATFCTLPGSNLVKRCYRMEYGGHRFRLDEHTGSWAGLYLCEIEATSLQELQTIVFPPFAMRDVTADSHYSGAYLARHLPDLSL